MRNFRARSVRFREMGSDQVKKGRMSAWKGEWENVISGNHMDSVQEQTLAVLARGAIVDNKHNRILLLQRRRHSLTEEDLRAGAGPREKVLLEGKVGKRAKVT